MLLFTSCKDNTNYCIKDDKFLHNVQKYCNLRCKFQDKEKGFNLSMCYHTCIKYNCINWQNYVSFNTAK